jgi:hypothetical protein
MTKLQKDGGAAPRRRGRPAPAFAVVVPAQAPASGIAAAGILREAAGIVEGARNATHGDKERSFQAIAGMWNAYLAARKNPSALIQPVDVSNMMVVLKIGRSVQGEAVRDHYVDMAGYAAISGELQAGVP